jgi:MOSC domain-containing protein YiiM
MSTFTIAQLRIGRVQPLGARGVPSGIDKQPVDGPVMAGATGLSGDEQGDLRHHGGVDKAVHAYAASHLARWAAELPDAAARFVPGAFGENLVVEGADEAEICLGDLWRVGGVVLEVSQGRQPCWKLNLRFDRPDMARRVQGSGRTGWYFRVRQPGPLAAGQVATLDSRPNPHWPLTRVSHLLYHDRQDRPALAELAALPGLPERWRELALTRLATGQTEDWSRRVDTPPTADELSSD